MSKENKKEIEDKWGNDSEWAWIILLFMVCFGWGFPKDTQDHELRERVAKLEGQMDMIRR